MSTEISSFKTGPSLPADLTLNRIQYPYTLELPGAEVQAAATVCSEPLSNWLENQAQILNTWYCNYKAVLPPHEVYSILFLLG